MNANPPRLARWLLRRVLDGAARSAIVGDLDEEFSRYVVSRLGAPRARRWYWRQTVLSLAACLRGKAEETFDPDRPSLTNVRSILQDGHGLRTDLRAAVRFCLRSPMTSAAVILTLAIGVAANTAMFSVLNATFLKELPIANADRLVSVDSEGGGSFTYPEYLASRAAAGLKALFAGGRTSVMMGAGGSRRRVVVEMVTANYFATLGVEPASLGRPRYRLPQRLDPPRRDRSRTSARTRDPRVTRRRASPAASAVAVRAAAACGGGRRCGW